MSKNFFYVHNFSMRNNLSIEEIKSQIDKLKGQNIKMLVNKGRKKIEKLQGTVQNLYPSVFTVMLDEENGKSLATYSYTEVLCGHVKFI